MITSILVHKNLWGNLNSCNSEEPENPERQEHGQNSPNQNPERSSQFRGTSQLGANGSKHGQRKGGGKDDRDEAVFVGHDEGAREQRDGPSGGKSNSRGHGRLQRVGVVIHVNAKLISRVSSDHIHSREFHSHLQLNKIESEWYRIPQAIQLK